MINSRIEKFYLSCWISHCNIEAVEDTLLELARHFIHYGLHILFPGFVAKTFFGRSWKRAWLIMVCTMIVDLDHLLAQPIFDPGRCSIGYHPLHSYFAIVVYLIMFWIPKCRIVSVGLLLHMITDAQDCLWL